MSKMGKFKSFKSKVLSALLGVTMVCGSVGTTASLTATTAFAATKKLSAPKSVTATSTKNSVTLKWKKVSGADKYGVFQYKSGSWARVKYLSKSKTSAKITGLQADTTYKFKVAAYDKVRGKYVKGKLSGAKSIKTKAAPSPVTLTCTTPLPAELGYYGSGKWKNRSKITGFTYEYSPGYSDPSKGTLKIYFTGETLEWDNDSSYQDINVSLIDSEGYTVDTDDASRSITSGSGKFKDMDVWFYNIAPGKYTIELSDYGYGDKPSSGSDDATGGITVDMPTCPVDLRNTDYRGNWIATGTVTEVRYEVSGSKLHIYASGKKISDVNGAGQSRQFNIGWKLYEVTAEGDIVIDDGTIETLSIKENELFKDASDSTYKADIKAGNHYRIEIMGVSGIW